MAVIEQHCHHTLYWKESKITLLNILKQKDYEEDDF